MNDFIEKLKSYNLEDRTLKTLRDMLVGTYDGYMINNKRNTLNILIKLAYMLGKEVGKEEMRNIKDELD